MVRAEKEEEEEEEFVPRLASKIIHQRLASHCVTNEDSHIKLCVCVCVCVYLPNQSAEFRRDAAQFLLLAVDSKQTK